MYNLDKLYDLREKTPKIIKKLFPKILKRKINKKFFRYYFISTSLTKLPNSNYQDERNIKYQISLVEKFKKIKKQSSFMSCPHLMPLLLMKYKTDDNFSFLDVGGEKIDFYLELKKNFKNVNYYIFNLKAVNEIFRELKHKFDFKDLQVIDDIKEIFNQNFDFVNFGSCIQYFGEYENILYKIANNSKSVFFSGTTLYNSPDVKLEKHFIVKQVNVLPKINYLYFFNKKHFYEIFTQKDFNLVFENTNFTDNVNYDNFKKQLDSIEYIDVLFTKR